MTKFRDFKKATALALALAAGFGVSSAALAGVQATAVLEVKNFQIQNSTTGAILDISNFLPNATVIDFGSNTASLSGFTTVTNNGSVTSGPMDIAQACLGVICPAANSFTHTAPPPGAGTTLARADSSLSGAPLTGLGGGSSGALAQTVAEVLLTTNKTGGGGSDLGLNTLFTIGLTSVTTLRLDFFADLYLRTFLSADANVPGSAAQARSALSFNIDDVLLGSNVFSWAPNGQAGGITGGTEIFDGTNLNTTINSLVPGTTSVRDLAGDQHFQADVTLGAGLYQFSINHAVFANAKQDIPEPATLFLAGIALVGAVVARRRAKIAA